MSEALRDDHLCTPHPSRLARSHPRFADIVEAHGEAMMAGRPDYRDPVTGFRVMTAATLAAGGACCSLGCRHCPFVGAGESPPP